MCAYINEYYKSLQMDKISVEIILNYIVFTKLEKCKHYNWFFGVSKWSNIQCFESDHT